MCCEPLSGATLAKASKVFGGHLVSRVAFCCGNNCKAVSTKHLFLVNSVFSVTKIIPTDIDALFGTKSSFAGSF